VSPSRLGRRGGGRSQERDETHTSWREAIRHHGLDTVVATGWGTLLFWLNPGYFWWVTPIIGALILSVPVSVFASRVRPGDRARRLGLFLIPEDAEPPPSSSTSTRSAATPARPRNACRRRSATGSCASPSTRSPTPSTARSSGT